LSGRELAHHARAAVARGISTQFEEKNPCIARARRARVGLTVFPHWIQIRDVAAAISQSCDRKSKFGLRHDITLSQLYVMTKSEF
jgi:hypothetical protein